MSEREPQIIRHDESDIFPVGKELKERILQTYLGLKGHYNYENHLGRGVDERTSRHWKNFRILGDKVECPEAIFVYNRNLGNQISARGFVGFPRSTWSWPRWRRTEPSRTYHVGRTMPLAPGVSVERRNAVCSHDDFQVTIGPEQTEILHEERHVHHQGLSNPLLPVRNTNLESLDLTALAGITKSGFGDKAAFSDPHARLLLCLNAIDLILSNVREIL